MQLHGSICALVTPFSADESIDVAALRQLIDWHVQAGTHALVIAGSTGEAALLDDDEYAQLLEESVQAAAGRLPIIAGIGSSSTKKCLALAKLAQRAKVDALLAVTPYYVRPTQTGLLDHYRTLADFALLPVILYNVPARTGCDLLPETVAQLSLHPGIVAIKEALPDLQRIKQLRAECADDFIILSGDDPTACEAMQLGAAGTISVAANVVPQAFAELCEAATSGDIRRAAQIDAALRPIYAALALQSNPIPVKYVLYRMKRLQLVLRKPLHALDAVHRDAAEHCVHLIQNSTATMAVTP